MCFFFYVDLLDRGVLVERKIFNVRTEESLGFFKKVGEYEKIK